MARKQTQVRSTKKPRAVRAVSGSTTGRYPQWKVELFRAGISERRQSASGQISGRAVRAPGA
jgi:hypothetical protein